MDLRLSSPQPLAVWLLSGVLLALLLSSCSCLPLVARSELRALRDLGALLSPQFPEWAPPWDCAKLNVSVVHEYAYYAKQGVHCDRAGHVISLSLQYPQTLRSIPESISALQHLTFIVLQMMEIAGPLPDGLFKLAALRKLDLFSNGIEGSFPGAVGKLVNLVSLDLSYNRFDGRIPDGLGKLRKLTYLNLKTNQLQGALPPSFALMWRLSYLLVDANIRCPRPPCKMPYAQRKGKFCSRCAAFCKTCPRLPRQSVNGVGGVPGGYSVRVHG